MYPLVMKMNIKKGKMFLSFHVHSQVQVQEWSCMYKLIHTRLYHEFSCTSSRPVCWFVLLSRSFYCFRWHRYCVIISSIIFKPIPDPVWKGIGLLVSISIVFRINGTLWFYDFSLLGIKEKSIGRLKKKKKLKELYFSKCPVKVPKLS